MLIRDEGLRSSDSVVVTRADDTDIKERIPKCGRPGKYIPILESLIGKPPPHTCFEPNR